MAKAVYYPKGERQKTIIKLLNSLEGRYSRWDIWQDFIVLSAVSIANAFGGPYREQREAMYLERSKKYSTSELEVLAQMLAEVVDEMEQNPDQDMLGELFMALGLANEWKGQFFTPYEDMKEGLISKTDFCDIRGQYDARIADALIAQEQIDRELSIYLSGEQSPNNWMKTFTEHRGLKSLTRAVVLECIEKVVIHKDEKLEIIFEHSEDYARLVSSLQEYAARGILGEAM